jgi:hypothetical protein
MTDRHGPRVQGGAAGFVRLLGHEVGRGALLPGVAHAHFGEAPPPAAYALQNVTVMLAHARMLAGDSLYVHPGLSAGVDMVEFVPASIK